MSLPVLSVGGAVLKTQPFGIVRKSRKNLTCPREEAPLFNVNLISSQAFKRGAAAEEPTFKPAGGSEKTLE